MAKYLFQGNYVGDGLKGLAEQGGSSRRDAAAAAMESVGGTLECMYYAFGDNDVYGIIDMPDEASAVAVSLLVNASGAVTISLTPLLDPEVIDAAAKKSPAYTPPAS
jgi:uncharacterized protein with GYD domain